MQERRLQSRSQGLGFVLRALFRAELEALGLLSGARWGARVEAGNLIRDFYRVRDAESLFWGHGGDRACVYVRGGLGAF